MVCFYLNSTNSNFLHVAMCELHSHDVHVTVLTATGKNFIIYLHQTKVFSTQTAKV